MYRHHSHHQWKEFLHANALYWTSALNDYLKLECNKMTQQMAQYGLQGNIATSIPSTSQQVAALLTKSG
jgi:hypothetical protein